MKIYTITEAFSMQPSSRVVGCEYGPNNRKLDRITEEDVHIEGDPFAFYVGYDADGNRMFEYRKGTVNVEYF